MANPPTFKQVDVTRAAKGAMAAGLGVARIEIDREGKIVILTGEPESSVVQKNDWD